MLRIGALAMVVWGCPAKIGIVWATADAAMGLMAPVNLIAVALLSGVAIKLSRDYDTKLRAGDPSPRLDAADFPEFGARVARSIWTRQCRAGA